MDVYIEVLKVQYQDNKRAKLIVIWWNKGWVGQPFMVSLRSRLKIVNFKGWRRLQDPIRFAEKQKAPDFSEAPQDHS